MCKNSPDENRWLEENAERFEAAWDRGQRPVIEDYLAQASEALRPKLLEVLLDIEIQRRRRSGECPLQWEYVQRFGEAYAALVQAAFGLEAATEVSPAGPAAGPPPGVPAGPCHWLPDPFPREFRFLRWVGGGAYGDVYEVEDLNMGGRRVAAKTLKANLPPSSRAKTLAALREDAIALTRFRHRNIVLVHAWLEHHGEPYVILEYVPGGSLARQLELAGKLTWARAARYIADVAEALQAVHARSIIHRDIKPANILLNAETDEAMLTDFGLAVLATLVGQPGGTPAYMAPEAFAGQATEWTDVYSLAASFFHLGTGEPPFRERDLLDLWRAKERGLPEQDPRLADVPDVLEPILRAGLEPSPGHRISLKEFTTRLRTALDEVLVDSLSQSRAKAFLRLEVGRQVGPNRYEPLPSQPVPLGAGRNAVLKPAPEAAARRPLRTGETLRLEAVADQTGHLSVWNIGPTGDVGRLYPQEPPAPVAPPSLPAHRRLLVGDIELTPPAGRERLVALWTRRPLDLDLSPPAPLAPNEVPPSPEYRATRALEQVQERLGRLPPADWQALVLEFEHRPDIV